MKPGPVNHPQKYGGKLQAPPKEKLPPGWLFSLPEPKTYRAGPRLALDKEKRSLALRHKKQVGGRHLRIEHKEKEYIASPSVSRTRALRAPRCSRMVTARWSDLHGDSNMSRLPNFQENLKKRNSKGWLNKGWVLKTNGPFREIGKKKARWKKTIVKRIRPRKQRRGPTARIAGEGGYGHT